MENTFTFHSILHDEYTLNRRRVILDTCEIRPGVWETMLMTQDGWEITSLTNYSEAAARTDYAHLRKVYGPDDSAPPLSGKYARLRDDLRAAAEAARSAAALTDDSGTCNCDAAALALPRWRESLVEQAAKEAGCGCSDWALFGKKHYVFFPRDIPGQAYKRETAAEAMTQKLKDLGYDAFNFSQMD